MWESYSLKLKNLILGFLLKNNKIEHYALNLSDKTFSSHGLFFLQKKSITDIYNSVYSKVDLEVQTYTCMVLNIINKISISENVL